MRVQFYGVRGSLPTPQTTRQFHEKLARILVAARDVDLHSPDAVREFCLSLPADLRRVVGGNTSCVEITAGDGRRLVCDAGSGMREYGHDLVRRAAADRSIPREVHILISHTHWDHICGFPFFAPLYVPHWDVHVWGAHPDLEARMRDQQHPYHFPVAFDKYEPAVRVHEIPEGETVEIAGMRVTPGKIDHPGDSYAYRIESPADGTRLIYATDGGFDRESPEMQELLGRGFFADAGALIFDAMFSLPELERKRDWGHSAPGIGIDLCLEQRIHTLVLFHHNPDSDDSTLYAALRDARNDVARKGATDRLAVLLACENWGFDVSPTP